MAQGETYEAFVDKFKPKKTTDDCYTPPSVMKCVKDWVVEKYGADRGSFVRPFWPGGDYESYDYPEGCVVVDNPPFSIFAKIVQHYAARGIKFFLFAPALTMLSSARTADVACAIVADANITFENGAVVRCGFLTNLEAEYVLKTEPELAKRIKVVCDALSREQHKEFPKYVYPDHIITCALAQKYAKYGVPYAVKRSDMLFVRGLDAQKEQGKSIFGGGLLLSEKAAAEKAAAEKAAAEKAAAHVWELSTRERALVDGLGRKA